MTSIYKGDDTNAFGQNLLRITFTVPENKKVTKAKFICGKNVVKTFNNPVSPLLVNLTSKETELLDRYNTCYFTIYDEFGLQYTYNPNITIQTIDKVV